MIKLNYFSNLSEDVKIGGGTSVNAMTLFELKKHFSLEVFAPINPPGILHQSIFSKIQKLLQFPRNFYFFSNKRLEQIAQLVQSHHYESADYLFFHGATPWVMLQPKKPYGLHIDACFLSYLETNHDRSNFSSKDVKRIVDLEKSFLQKATHVFFRSEWALNETIKHYNIPSSNFHATMRGGAIEIPKDSEIAFDEIIEPYFIFIAFDFLGKGGPTVVDAFKKIMKPHPNTQLFIVGGKPPEAFLNIPGVFFKGAFDKKNKNELKEYLSLLSNAIALVHPTKKDTSPLVLTEAGYYGVPAITSNIYAIKELVKHDETGFLLNNPDDTLELASYMDTLLKMDTLTYHELKKKVRRFQLENFTWEKTGNKISTLINESIINNSAN